MGSTLALLAALILVRGAPPPRDPAVLGAPARWLRGALRPRPPRARAGAGGAARALPRGCEL